MEISLLWFLSNAQMERFNKQNTMSFRYLAMNEKCRFIGSYTYSQSLRICTRLIQTKENNFSLEESINRIGGFTLNNCHILLIGNINWLHIMWKNTVNINLLSTSLKARLKMTHSHRRNRNRCVYILKWIAKSFFSSEIYVHHHHICSWQLIFTWIPLIGASRNGWRACHNNDFIIITVVARRQCYSKSIEYRFLIQTPRDCMYCASKWLDQMFCFVERFYILCLWSNRQCAE